MRAYVATKHVPENSTFVHMYAYCSDESLNKVKLSYLVVYGVCRAMYVVQACTRTCVCE